MTELESPEGHGHPCFDVCREEDETPVPDDNFQIRIQELEDEIEIRLG